MARRFDTIVMDFDGVLTDGTFWWGPGGEEWKRLSFRDVMGVARGSRAGLRFAIISGEDSPLVDRYAAKLRITDVCKGTRDKRAALKELIARTGSDLARVAYIGDDVNDLEAMAIVGLSAAPADAHPEVLRVVGRVLAHPGGRGAVRELVDAILDEGDTP